MGPAASWETQGVLLRTLFDTVDPQEFAWTSDVEDDCLHRIALTKRRLSLPESSETLLRLLKTNHIVEHAIRHQR